jgi:4-carboxymuconolactone decarboxylase
VKDRLPPIPYDQMTDVQRHAAEELTAGPRGSLRGPFVPLLRSPELMRRLQKTGEYLRWNSALSRKLTELVTVITARHWMQPYEWGMHYPLALKEGVSEATLAAVIEGRRPDGLDTDEQAAYDFCMALHHEKRVGDAVYARALNQFGEQGVIDMTAICGYYSALAMILNVAQTPPPKSSAPPLPGFEELFLE